jgi:hypothetical protein
MRSPLFSLILWAFVGLVIVNSVIIIGWMTWTHSDFHEAKDLTLPPGSSRTTDSAPIPEPRFDSFRSRHWNHTGTPQLWDDAISLRTGRFPLFGTKEFRKTCRWALNTSFVAENEAGSHRCTILARPKSDTREGISAWVGQITTGFIMARQTGCMFLVDYAEGINVSEIILARKSGLDWRVPAGFTCQKDCSLAGFVYPRGGGKEFQNFSGFLAAVPNYRNPYGGETDYRLSKGFSGLKKTLGKSVGFDLESSMACVFRSLMELSPNAVKYQPDLFTTFLPTLYKAPFVLTLYIRTGHTEHVAESEESSKARYQKRAMPIIDCALQLEAEAWQLNRPQHVVWLLITDSPSLKIWVTKTFSEEGFRNIMVTRAHGAHTKTAGQPSTADFAEGFLDWFLIGESSDVVVSDENAPSFGNTAAFRTARPYYKFPSGKGEGPCRRITPTLK